MVKYRGILVHVRSSADLRRRTSSIRFCQLKLVTLNSVESELNSDSITFLYCTNVNLNSEVISGRILRLKSQLQGLSVTQGKHGMSLTWPEMTSTHAALGFPLVKHYVIQLISLEMETPFIWTDEELRKTRTAVKILQLCHPRHRNLSTRVWL